MKKDIYVFTDNFPFGIGEAFLNSEAAVLPRYFERVCSEVVAAVVLVVPLVVLTS